MRQRKLKTSMRLNIMIKRELALKLMADYYKENKKKYPSSIRKYREEIIAFIMNGLPPKEAFNKV